MTDEAKKYDIIVHYPNGDAPTDTYTYQDLDLAVEGIANIALASIKKKPKVRRLLEILPTPIPIKEKEPDVTTADSTSGADESGT